jgi:hypothetical protein
VCCEEAHELGTEAPSSNRRPSFIEVWIEEVMMRESFMAARLEARDMPAGRTSTRRMVREAVPGRRHA